MGGEFLVPVAVDESVGGGALGVAVSDSVPVPEGSSVGLIEVSGSPEVIDELVDELRTVGSPAADPLDPADPLAAIRAEIADLRGRLTIREKLAGEISAASINVERAASSVSICESAVEEAKGDLKAAKERYDQAVNTLREIVRDVATGQGRLDFDAAAAGVELVDNGETVTANSLEVPTEGPAAAPEEDPAITAPVCELGKKLLRKAVGAEVFDAAKDSEEPIGLTDKQLEVIEGEGCTTIADLERKLREYPLFLQDLKGFGEQAQNRLTASLMAWRAKYPH